MNLQLRNSCSLVTLCFGLALPTTLAAESVPSLLIPEVSLSKVSTPLIERKSSRITEYPHPSLEVTTLSDKFDDSASFTMVSKGEIKRKLQDQRSIVMNAEGKTETHSDIRRMLALDGGGVKGLFSILALCILEELINDPVNKKTKDKLLAQKRERLKVSNKKDDETRLYIRDLFDVVTGTSTGAILAAGLFSTRNYTAIELAKIYWHFRYKIFDENKRSTPFGIGITYATYDTKGLREVIQDKLGTSHLADVHQPIYIIALNESKQALAIFSSDQIAGDTDNLHQTYMKDAVFYSALAPTYLPGVKGDTDTGQVLFSDGGPVANNPAPIALAKDKMSHGNPYEIYSFGTGHKKSQKERSGDDGAMVVAGVLKNTMKTSERLALTQLEDEVRTPTSQVHYLARINPEIDDRNVKMDDTSRSFAEYVKIKTFSLTMGPVFEDMVARLGFQMKDLTEIHALVEKKLNALSSNRFKDLDKYEKELVLRRIIDLDFKSYQQRLYVDESGNFKQIENIDAFLDEVTDYIYLKKKEGDSLISKLGSLISKSPEDDILEFLPRCREFNRLCMGQKTLSEPELNLLLSEQQTLFTHEQLQSLSPKIVIRGDGKWFNSVGSKDSTLGGKLVFNMFRLFVDLCEGKIMPQDSKVAFIYTDNKSPFAHLPALIFWINMFEATKDKLTKQQVSILHDNLQKYVSQVFMSRSYTGEAFARVVRDSRYQSLIDGLKAYKLKFYAD